MGELYGSTEEEKWGSALTLEAFQKYHMETYYYRNFIACTCNIFLFFFFSSWCLLLFHMWKSQSFKSFSHCRESGSCSTLRAINIASFVNRLKFVLYVLMHVFLIWTIKNLISILKLEVSMLYQIWSVYEVSFIQVFFYLKKLQWDFFTVLLNFLFSVFTDQIAFFSLSPSSSSINSPSDHFILHCIPSIKLILTSFKWIHLRFKIYLWRRNLIYFLEIYTF